MANLVKLLLFLLVGPPVGAVAFSEEIDIAGKAYQIRNGKIAIPPERLAESIELQLAQDPGSEPKQPAMFFRESTRVGDYGVIRDESKGRNANADPPVEYTLKQHLRVLQRMSDHEALVNVDIKITARALSGLVRDVPVSRDFSASFYFDGFDFTNVADGASLDFSGQGVIAAGLYEYTTALGARRTVLLIRPALLPPMPPRPLQPPKKVVPDALHPAFSPPENREWIDGAGKVIVTGYLINYDKGNVFIFSDESGEIIEMKLSELGSAGQKWVRGKLRIQTEQRRQSEREARMKKRK